MTGRYLNAHRCGSTWVSQADAVTEMCPGRTGCPVPCSRYPLHACSHCVEEDQTPPYMHHQLSPPERDTQTCHFGITGLLVVNVNKNYLTDIMIVIVDVIKHVHHLCGCAEVAQCGETHNIAEVNGNLVKELRFHFSCFL